MGGLVKTLTLGQQPGFSHQAFSRVMPRFGQKSLL